MAREFERHSLVSPEKHLFKTWLLNSDISGVHSHTEIPVYAAKVFEYRSECFIHPNHYKPGTFLGIYKIRHADESFSWAARQTKLLPDIYPLIDSGFKQQFEESVYLVDMNFNNTIAGYSELRRVFTNDPFFMGKPFNQWSGTESEYRRRGFSKRRLFTLNALSQMLYRLPVHSSDHFVFINQDGVGSQPEKLLWESLVDQGVAIKYSETVDNEIPIDRYVFTNNPQAVTPNTPKVNWPLL